MAARTLNCFNANRWRNALIERQTNHFECDVNVVSTTNEDLNFLLLLLKRTFVGFSAQIHDQNDKSEK